MMKTPKRMLRVATLGLAVVALVAVGFAGSVGGIQDDGFFDRWLVTNVACNGTSGNGEIIVSYARTYNHPAGGDVLGTWKRTVPAPTVNVAAPFGSTNVAGGSGGGNAIIGTNVPTEVVYPGTYVLSRQILIGGQPTYQQDLTITCDAPGSGYAGFSENYFLLPLSALTVVPNPALAGQQVTVSGTDCAPLALADPASITTGTGVGMFSVSVTIGFPTPLVLAPTNLDPTTGAWSVQFVVPAGTPFGTYDVRATCSGGTPTNGASVLSYFRTPALQTNDQFPLSYPTATITVGPTAIARTPQLTG